MYPNTYMTAIYYMTRSIKLEFSSIKPPSLSLSLSRPQIIIIIPYSTHHQSLYILWLLFSFTFYLFVPFFFLFQTIMMPSLTRNISLVLMILCTVCSIESRARISTNKRREKSNINLCSKDIDMKLACHCSHDDNRRTVMEVDCLVSLFLFLLLLVLIK